MASEFLTIEAGDSVIKVCSITGKGKGKAGRINKAFIFRTPEGTVKDGVIENHVLLAEKLKERLAENGVTAIKNVVFSLASGKVATREAVIPPVKENRIRAVLDANMQEYFPMDISKYQIDFGMVRQTETEGEKSLSLTVMAAPLSIIDSYVRFAREAGLTIDAIDYAGNSQFQMIKSLGNKKVSMYINVECQYSYVTIAAGDVLVFQRILPYGGNEYIEAYIAASPQDPGYMAALSACCVPLQSMREEGILSEETALDSLSRLVTGIERSIDFFGTLRWKDPLEEVILLGPCAHLAGLREAISEATGFSEVYYFEDAPAAAPLGSDAMLISRVVSAYGASIAPVKLLPEQAEEAKKSLGIFDKDNKFLLIIGGVICLGLALTGGILALNVRAENRELTEQRDKLQRDIEDTRYVEAIEAAYFEYITDAFAYGAVELIVARNMNNAGLVDFFEELEEKMPSDLSLLSAVCTNDGVTLNVSVMSLEAAAKVLVEFRTFNSLQIVATSAVNELVDEAGVPFYAFTVSCLYSAGFLPDIDLTPPESPPPPAPPQDSIDDLMN